MKKILVLILALVVCACAKKTPQPEMETTEEAALWQKMENAPAIDGPYRLQLSFRFGDEGNTRRVTAILWGNNDEHLRLDIMAGVGALVAKIEENGDQFLLSEARNNRAFSHDGPNRPLLKIGVPLPFTLVQLADLLNGHYGGVFGREYASAGMDDGNAVYTLEGNASGELAVSSAGLPLAWQQAGGNGWRLTMEYDDKSLPKSLKLANPNGKKAILLIKEREAPAEPFSAEQLKVELPGDIEIRPLTAYKPS